MGDMSHDRSGIPASEQSPELHGDQMEIFWALLGKSPQLADLYVGAVSALGREQNPDRLAHCALSLRALIEKLPSVLGVAIAPVSELSAEVEKLEAPFVAARGGPEYSDGRWEGPLGSLVRALLEAVEALMEWRSAQRQTRREAVKVMLQGLDPSGSAVPGPLGDRTVREWMESYRLFGAVLHHSAIEEREFREAVSRFERLLVTLLCPRPFVDFDEIDRLVTEAEHGA